MTKGSIVESNSSSSSSSTVPSLVLPPASSWDKLKTAYLSKTPLKAKAIDAYLLCCFVMGILQLAFCITTKGRNYQQFLAGFLSCVGSFVMAANVRLQMDLVNGESRPRTIVEFVIGSVLLHLLTANVINMSH